MWIISGLQEMGTHWGAITEKGKTVDANCENMRYLKIALGRFEFGKMQSSVAVTVICDAEAEGATSSRGRSQNSLSSGGWRKFMPHFCLPY